MSARRQRPDCVKPGAVALDGATGQVGQVQQIGPVYGIGPSTLIDHQRAWLRPCAGGLEWESSLHDLQPPGGGTTVSGTDAPSVGDLVQDADGRQLVVTDQRSGQLIVRPLHGPGEHPVEDPGGLMVVARRGTWSGHPDGGSAG